MSEIQRRTQGIHHAGLSVPDLAASRRFFEAGLGFETVGEVPDPPLHVTHRREDPRRARRSRLLSGPTTGAAS